MREDGNNSWYYGVGKRGAQQSQDFVQEPQNPHIVLTLARHWLTAYTDTAAV